MLLPPKRMCVSAAVAALNAAVWLAKGFMRHGRAAHCAAGTTAAYKVAALRQLLREFPATKLVKVCVCVSPSCFADAMGDADGFVLCEGLG